MFYFSIEKPMLKRQTNNPDDFYIFAPNLKKTYDKDNISEYLFDYDKNILNNMFHFPIEKPELKRQTNSPDDFLEYLFYYDKNILNIFYFPIEKPKLRRQTNSPDDFCIFVPKLKKIYDKDIFLENLFDHDKNILNIFDNQIEKPELIRQTNSPDNFFCNFNYLNQINY